MEWRLIKAFHEVARLGSFTKAAEATFRTQSALSQQIKALEEEVGHTLIERVGQRKLRLTEEGELFYDFAEDVLRRYGVFTEALESRKGLRRGKLSVAAPFTTLFHLLPGVFRAYLRDWPEVQLAIFDRPQKTVVELVKSGEADFGLASESALPADVEVFRWKKVETTLMTLLDDPLASLRRPLTLEEISERPLILPPKSPASISRPQVESRLKALGLPCRVTLESSNVDLSALYVELGLGVAFASIVRDLSSLKTESLAFIGLNHLFDSDHVAVFTRRGAVLSPHKIAFLDLLLS